MELRSQVGGVLPILLTQASHELRNPVLPHSGVTLAVGPVESELSLTRDDPDE